MAKQPITSSSSSQTQEQIEEFTTLDRLLHVSAGTPSFSIAICNSPALRDHLIQRILAAHPGVLVVPIPSGTVDVFGVILESTGDSVPEAIFVTGIENSISSGDNYPLTLRSLNASRDLWGPRYPCPVVFWIPEYVAALVPTVAPDLWRFKSHTFEFVASPLDNLTKAEVHMAGDLTLAGSLTKTEKLFRIAELEQRLQEAGTPPSPSLLPHVRQWTNELAYLYVELGRLDDAVTLRSKALHFERVQGNTDVQAVHLGNLGRIALQRGEFDKAEDLIREALKLYQENNSLDREASALGNLGGIAQARGDLETAQLLHRQALEINRQLGNSKGETHQLGNLGMIAWRRGEYREAEHLLRQALSISQKRGDLKGQAIVLGNLGVVQEARGDVAGAEQSYKAALQLDHQLGRLEGQAASLGNLGVLAARSGRLEEAENYLQESLRIYREIGAPQEMALSLVNLGGIAEDMEKYDQASLCFNQAKELYLQLGLHAKAARVEERIARHAPS